MGNCLSRKEALKLQMVCSTCILYHKSHKNPYQYYKSHENLHQYYKSHKVYQTIKLEVHYDKIIITLYLLFAFFSILVCIALCNDDNVSFTQQLVGELKPSCLALIGYRRLYHFVVDTIWDLVEYVAVTDIAWSHYQVSSKCTLFSTVHFSALYTHPCKEIYTQRRASAMVSRKC